MMSESLPKPLLVFSGEANCSIGLVTLLVRLRNPRTTLSMASMQVHTYMMSIQKRNRMRLQGRS